jgi:hypothetical protein
MRKKSVKSILLLLICGSLLIFCAGCERDGEAESEKKQFEIDKTFERGPLTVHVRLDKGKLSIAETVWLELEAAVEPRYEVRMPKVDKVLEHFGIVDWDSLPDKLDENSKIVSTNRYRLEPFLSGTYEIPALTFEFNDVNDVEEKKHELATEPITLEVTSLLGEQRAELVIEDIEDVVDMPRKASLWWAWVLIAAVVVAGRVSWFLLRRKRTLERIRMFKPAHEIAYALLRALVKEDLVAKGQVKEFYEHISSILRHYIEHRFDLRAPERTTEEFLAELQYTNVLSASDKDSLEQFLTHCDLVKFAKHSPTTEQIQRTFDLVKQFIEKTKSDERKIDVTDNVQAREPVEAEVA